MGFFSKLAFWKKGDMDFGAGPDPLANPHFDPGQGMAGNGMQGMDPQGMGGAGQDPFGPGANPMMQDPYAAQQGGMEKATPYVSGPGQTPMGMGVGQSPPGGYGQTQGQGYGEQAYPSMGPNLEKDLQIISLKLDAIKSELDSIRQRIEKIERIADQDAAKAKKVEYGW